LFSVKGKQLSHADVENMILTKEKFPEWGTPFGNFFEILILE